MSNSIKLFLLVLGLFLGGFALFEGVHIGVLYVLLPVWVLTVVFWSPKKG